MANNMLLPPRLREQLNRTIACVFSDAVRFIEPATWPSLAAEISSELDIALKFAIATEAAALNGRLSLTNRLPTELWCDIWERLPFLDRVALTQVCKHWKDISLSCPALWSQVTFYTSIHSKVCVCSECRPDLPDSARYGSFSPFHPLAPGWADSPYRKKSSNIPFASQILARSRDLPLHLELDIVPFTPDTAAFPALAEHLLPHLSRIYSLSVRACCVFSLDMVLPGIDSLPSLRAITLDTLHVPFGSAPARESHLLDRPMSFPRLRAIDLRSFDIRWPVTDLSLNFPAVTSVAFIADDLDDIAAVLRACPAVRSLNIDYSHLHRWPFTPKQPEIQELHNLVPRLDSLVLRDTHILKVPTWIIEALYRPDHRLVSISSCSTCSSMPYAPRIFSDLGDGVHLIFARRPLEGVLRTIESVGSMLHATDAAGKTRRLALAREKQNSLLQCIDERYLRPDSIVRLTVDASHWQWFISGFLFGPAITTLEITIYDIADVLNCALALDAMDTECFPSLQCLTIGVAPTVNLCPEAAPAIAVFIRRMGLSLPIDTLAMNKGILPCDGTLFSGLAHRILFQ